MNRTLEVIAMGYTLEQFAAKCHDALKSKAGTEGRKAVCALVEDVLKDRDFVAKYIPEGTPERKVLYEDPELGFTILAHAYVGAKNSKPHDHGPSWAIYGQAAGETIMTDWECMARPTETTPGKAKHVRDYAMKPGDAHLYDPGVLHSPRREGSTRLLRIEGVNMDRVKRLPYEAVDTVTHAA
jgi:predicted metal-dependent enzyme (double-stranded beta helix superfamily)